MPFAAIIPLLTTLITTAATLYAQDESNKQAAKQRKRYENQLQGRVDDLNEWFNREYYRDFLDTDIARSSIRGLMQQQDRQLEAINNAAAQGGATAESNIAAKGKLNEGFADAIARLLGYGTQYKNDLRSQYDYRLQSLYQPINDLQQQRINDYALNSQNITAAGNSLSSTAGMIDWETLLRNQNKGGWDSGGYGIPAGPTIQGF